jgi:hypothetical protein
VGALYAPSARKVRSWDVDGKGFRGISAALWFNAPMEGQEQDPFLATFPVLRIFAGGVHSKTGGGLDSRRPHDSLLWWADCDHTW